MNGFPEVNPGTVSFVQVKHDRWCPMLFNSPGECVCRPDVVVVDERVFINGINRMNRAQRRAAEREARRTDRRTGGRR